MKKNDIYQLEISDLSEDGSGIGRIDGMVVFCRGMLPGERGTVKIIKVTKAYAVGKMLSRDTTAAFRIEPPFCESFSKGCGGCAFCHVSYEEQLRFKQQRVSDCLLRIGGLEHAAKIVAPVIAAEKPFYYRNKSIYPFSPGSDGSAVCGFYAMNSHRVIPLPECGCGLENDMSHKIRTFTQQFLNRHTISAYDESAGCGIFRALMVRTGYRGTPEALVVLVINADTLPHLNEYLSELSAACPFVASVYLCSNKENTNVVLRGTMQHVFGKATIRDAIGDFPNAPVFEISPLSFYQVHPAQTERLYNAVYTCMPDRPCLIYDIYCGIGTIGLYLLSRLAASGKTKEQLPKLAGVEVIPSAVDDARKNAARNGIDTAEFYCGDASQVTPQVLAKHGTPSVVILDPPRKGCDNALIETVLSSGTENIIYVSCNPATLARDLKKLCASGYTCMRVQPVDMFPHSGHVETVVLLTKNRFSKRP